MARAALAAAREAAKARRAAAPKKKIQKKARPSGDPQLFGSAIFDLINDRGWQQEMAVGGVIGRWKELVGEDLASHVQPTSFKDGTLYLAADSTAWATQVRLLAPDLVRQLAKEANGLIQRIEVSGPAAPSWKKGPRSARGRGPRDTYG